MLLIDLPHRNGASLEIHQEHGVCGELLIFDTNQQFATHTAEFKRQSTDYVAALKAAGLAASYYEQSGKNHFTAIDGFLDQNSDLCRRVQSFIADCESGKRSG
jgi:hypothetical protein